MDDTTLLIGIVLVLAYLIVMPVAVAIVFKRSARLQQWNVQLEQTVAQLQASLARLTAQVNRLNPTVTPTLPASSVRAPASADTVDTQVEPDVSGENNDNPNKVTVSQRSDQLTTVDPSPHQDTAPRDGEMISVEKHSGILSSLAGWLLQGNPLAKIGILLLFFGLAYLMRYTIERDMLSIQWRLGVAALISGGLLAFGWRLRHKQRLYALILQGGAVGALYITIFGAFRLYLLLPYLLAFTLLLLVCAASVGLAVIQRSLSLAMLASIGGYLAPILLSQGGGNHVVLFSYYLLLSLGILAISARQSWRELNLLGLIFTFGVAAIWGAKYYQQDFYLSSQLFLIANILLFGVGALLFSLRHQSVGKQVVDGVLLFAPPLIGFGMQYLITGHWEYGPAGSALAYGLGYLVLGWLTRKRLPRLGLFAFALGGCFLTLAVPLSLTGQSTALIWMLEGLCILWAGLHQNQRRMGRSGSAVLLLGAASVAYAAITGELQSASFFFTFFTFGILAVASLCASLCWSRYRQVDGHRNRFSRGFFILGLMAWLIWLVYIVERAMTAYTDAFWHGSEFMPPWRTQALLQSPLFLLLFAVSGLLWNETGRRLKWPVLRHSAWLLWGFMLLAVLQQLVFADYRQFSLLNGGEQIAVWACWLGSFTVAYRLLYRETGDIPRLAERVFHLVLFWMVIGWLFLMADQYWYSRIPADVEEGAPILTVILLSAIILALVLPARHRLWPLTRWATLYNQTGLVPLVATLFTLLANANLLDGQIQWGSLTWPYVPFLNPLEISLFLGVTALALWYRRAISASAQSSAWKSRCRLALWGLIIWLLNGLLLRALAWYAQIPWSVDWLWDSRLVQTTFALLWTLAALVCMVWSTRRQQRGGWIMGALLLALTIIKLFLVDSAGGGGLARAIAFIGVAILILIVGYFAPLPPKKAMSQ
ncbi:DUF2339 domain-containing protein [Brenneria roseae subsp. americana]|uniref:DUF2339 domain-containing protein n=1 Tax=Brenneria roseae subsp. americana TaxID=1508507 RepID=A0A2U1TTX4_9GAMM|nr:DUF2339 domain-containing protein [Brenneria roseae]PWC12857.1 DUF2339 domain-containing protein [Brenneria roseae subsp. americana]